LVNYEALKDIANQKVMLVTRGGEEIELGLRKFSREDQKLITRAQADQFFKRAEGYGRR